MKPSALARVMKKKVKCASHTVIHSEINCIVFNTGSITLVVFFNGKSNFLLLFYSTFFADKLPEGITPTSPVPPLPFPDIKVILWAYTTINVTIEFFSKTFKLFLERTLAISNKGLYDNFFRSKCHFRLTRDNFLI